MNQTAQPFFLDVRFELNSMEEADKIRRVLIYNCNNIDKATIRPKPITSQYYFNRVKRLVYIYNHLVSDEEITLGVLYRDLKRILGMSYRTFQRDITHLIIQGKVYYQKTQGGITGKTTVIIKKEM